MFKGRVISRSNINGKVHTFQKDFDDYESYQSFLAENPDFNTTRIFENIWQPFQLWNPYPLFGKGSTIPPHEPSDAKYLPEGVSLEKYEKRREEKRLEQVEKAEKKLSLERSKSYLLDYIQEHPDDAEAKGDLEKINKEIEKL